ncbi:MAG: RNA 2',3'-cyclic phosphodiesterase [Minisyncoccota bacterium]
MNKTRRLFVGIPLSKELRKRIQRTQMTWPAEPVILTAPENLHVTLFFLGFVHEEDVADVCQKVGEACEDVEAFELIFNTIKLVENPADPKMIWLSGAPSEMLKNLQAKIEKIFSSFVIDKKSYRPHVTLAKIKKSKWRSLENPPLITETVNLIETVDTVAVFESLSIDDKRRYEQIDTFSLL